MRIGLISLGCPRNLVDSEVMLGLAQKAGHELTNDAAGADVLVVNTCAFINSAKQESIDAILEMAQHKKDGACQRLIVTGCLAERYRNELVAEIPEIDAVLGTGEVPEIVRAISGQTHNSAVPLQFFRGSRQVSFRSPQPRNSSFQPPAPRLGSHQLDPSFGEARRSDEGAEAASRHMARSALPTYIYDADTPRIFA